MEFDHCGIVYDGPRAVVLCDPESRVRYAVRLCKVADRLGLKYDDASQDAHLGIYSTPRGVGIVIRAPHRRHSPSPHGISAMVLTIVLEAAYLNLRQTRLRRADWFHLLRIGALNTRPSARTPLQNAIIEHRCEAVLNNPPLREVLTWAHDPNG